jgi:hypothetical protein
VFGRANHAGRYYEKAAAAIPPFLAQTLFNSQQQRSQIQAMPYERSCDNNAAQEAYGILLWRREPVPLYELRLLDGKQFLRIFPIAYVDGGFRFLLSPDFRLPAPAGGQRTRKRTKRLPATRAILRSAG